MTAEPIEHPPAPEPGLVTVAIPTFNGSRFLGDALESAARQTYEPIEILVVDDGSDDGSVEIAEEFAGNHPGLGFRILSNPHRLGLAGNWNRCVEMARGEYLKFLFQDDLLEPTCVEELVGAMQGSSSAGMAFAPRAIGVDGRRDWLTRRWISRNRTLHARFTRLESINDGGRLFREQMARDPYRNWIGEPTAVLLRTEMVRRAGGFNPRLKQLVDAELWLRLMCRGDVGFVDKRLATFRLHGKSATSQHVLDGAAWLDPLWMLEGLLADPCVRDQRLPVRRLRARALARVVRGELVRVMRRRPPAVFSRAGEVRTWRGTH